MGFVWNTLFSLKWALLDKHLKLWSFIEEREIELMESYITKIESLEKRSKGLIR